MKAIWILLMIIFIPIIDILNKYLKLKLPNLEYKYLSHKLDSGFISRSDLSEINYGDFLVWCSKFISHYGYDNVSIISANPEDNVNLFATNKKNKTYFKCSLCKFEQETDALEKGYKKIDIEDIEQLLGEMVADEIFNAVFITNNEFTDECEELIQSLPKQFNIKLIDGFTLISQYRNSMKITENLSNEIGGDNL